MDSYERLSHFLTPSPAERNSEFYATRAAGVIARRAKNPEAGINCLVSELTDKRPHVRWIAARELGLLEPRTVGAIPELNDALSDQHVTVRVFAAIAVWRSLKNHHVCEVVLVNALREPDLPAYSEPPSISGWAPSSQLIAITALGEIGPNLSDEAITTIGTILAEDDWLKRRAAAKAIEKIGPGAMSLEHLLISTLRSEHNQKVRSALADAIFAIHDP